MNESKANVTGRKLSQVWWLLAKKKFRAFRVRIIEGGSAPPASL